MANLPYNVAVPLVIRVLEEAPQVASLLVMVQREVGERLAAGAGDEAYGAVSVKVAYWATAAVVGRVPALGLHPQAPGRVGAGPAGPPARTGRAADSRRPGLRALRRGSSPWSGPASPTAARCSAGRSTARCSPRRSTAVGIRPTARAEELSLDEWERLAAWPAGPSRPGRTTRDAGQSDR